MNIFCAYYNTYCTSKQFNSIVSCVQNNKNDFAIKLLLKKIAESLTKPLSFTRLANIVKSSGTSLGKQTVINYVGYMTDSYLIFPLANYAAKLVEKNRSN